MMFRIFAVEPAPGIATTSAIGESFRRGVNLPFGAAGAYSSTVAAAGYGRDTGRMAPERRTRPAGDRGRVQIVTDPALEYLGLDALLDDLLVRIRDALRSDTVVI